MQIVAWEDGRLLPAPRKIQPNKRETKYPVTCSECGNTRHLVRNAARNAEQNDVCKHCSGKEKFNRMISLYGFNIALEKVREYRLQNPSSLETQVITLLDRIGVEYEREVIIERDGRYTMFDFILPHYALIVEVDGEYVHSVRCNESHIRQQETAEFIEMQLVRIPEDKIEMLFNYL